jgi:signal transduction histidine kinase/ligand-binding sensor domain-containing protein/CheY-like chemotaxis protein/AraC-like DNA-binding protein
MKQLFGILFLVVLGNVFAMGQMSFQRFNISHGLSNNSVRVVYQDRQGFLWFGTLNGLNRFDGYTFKEYHYRPNDSTSITNNRISNIAQDSRGMFYLTTFDGGIHQFDPVSERFKAVKLKSVLKNRNFNALFLHQTSADVFWSRSLNNGFVRIISNPKASEGFELEHVSTSIGLPGDTVNFVYKASDRSIWIGTSQGLLRFTSDTITMDASIVKSSIVAKGLNVTTVHEANGTIWLGTKGNGVYYMPLGGLKPIQLAIGAKANQQVTSISSDTRGHIYVGTDGSGLVDVDGNTLSVTVFNTYNSSIVSNRINQLYKDRFGILWLVTDVRGLMAFDGSTKTLTYHSLNAKARASLAENDQQLFLEDSNGTLWVGIYGGGLCKYNRHLATFEQYTHNIQNPQSIAGDYILALAEDRSQNLWVGLYNGGVCKTNLKPSGFKPLKVTDDIQQVFQNEVRCLLQDSEQQLYIGTKGGDVFRHGSSLMGLSGGVGDKSFSYRGFDKAVYSLFEDRDKNLWIGTKGNGIFIVRHSERNKPNPNYVHLKHPTNSEFSNYGNNVYDIKQDVHGQYWVASYSGGLFLLAQPFDNPTWTNFHYQPGNPYTLSDDRIRQLLFDKDNNLWIATSNGLNILAAQYLNKPEKKFTRIVNAPGVNENISNNDVMAMAIHPNGKIYLGTFGGGLNISEKLDVDKGIFKWQHVMKENGLSSNVIQSIQIDNKNMIWLATDNGLNHMDPRTLTIETFFDHDGLGSNLFSESAALVTRKGELILGHAKGLVTFDPLALRKDSTRHAVLITNVRINERDLAPAGSQNIELDYQHNNITFEFATLDLKSPEKHLYSFLLDGFDDDWSKPATSNTVNYRGLRPGSYTFRIRGTNSDGVWMHTTATFTFVIKPPFWNSPAGYALLSLVIVGLTIGFYYLKLKQVKLQHDLKINESLNEQKIRYYTNISHEFKTPLSLILNPTLEILENKNATESIKQKAHDIQRNARYLLHLIEQILDFRRIREDRATLQIRQFNIVEFFREMHLVFVPLANKKEIELKLNCNLQDYQGFADVKYLEKICYNLLANAIKHTPRRKKIDVDVMVDEKNQTLTLKVIDEGVGIQQAELPRVFERFYKSQDSSGIGLFFTRELVTQHSGEIWAESEPGKGSTFTVMLPIGQAAYMPELFAGEMNSRSFDFEASEAIEMAYDIQSDEAVMPLRKMSSQRESLLIVEDNPNLRLFLMEKLGEKFNVVGAENGKEALVQSKKHPFDLIVCDYMMPEMDGMETLKRLRTDMSTSTIPVIVLTAISNEEQIAEAFELGADDYITKPFNINNLTVRIENLINQRKRLKQSYTHEPEFSKDDVPGTNADKDFIEHVTKIIDENIANIDFSVDYIADKMAVSRTVFYKKMKLISGYSPNEFIQLIRMKKAAFLIKNSNLPIAEIALKVGFNDSNYFSKCFKSHFGMPPSVYQKQG